MHIFFEAPNILYIVHLSLAEKKQEPDMFIWPYNELTFFELLLLVVIVICKSIGATRLFVVFNCLKKKSP